MQNQFGFLIDKETTPQPKQFKVLLIGDTCTDKYVYGTVTRISPEAPVPVMVYDRVETAKGMAHNVRENIMSFGDEVYMMTHESQITKTRYVDSKSNQQIMRLDENDEAEDFGWELPTEKFDVMVISDYNKGFLSEEKIEELVKWFNGPVFIDSKKTRLPKQCFIKINDREAQKLEGDYANLIVTKGSQGCTWNGRSFPGINVPVFDVAGAGDTFLAALVHFYLLLGTIDRAIPYANKAAAIAVTHFGTYVLSKDDINEIRC
ncbi:hypothetical protein SXBG_00219 [Synechococcus phage S-CAM1]|jgi:D-beta-D-heptose 7-phosphate kinase/D-beta-D-heptose 1-phosphate adenosyltransferase|uniref:Carbohydrate kinase PfkB domain-containing protein n=1 Tax=Synechococcus phage S-CAM1 TaxID=754037 RepID=M4QF80_9CAUD|nr:hypothetical protein SXBG_00219 [Synechococcus phage S-CAM1]AGH26954.1 hypothetical protein SXBG_00219 [Synechococcus phage S-CAM1]